MGLAAERADVSNVVQGPLKSHCHSLKGETEQGEMLLHVFRLEARAQKGTQSTHLAPLPEILQALVYPPEALKYVKWTKILPPILFPHKIKLGEKWGGRK